MRIESLVFDIGNVLVPFDWRPFRNRLQADCTKLTTAGETEFRTLMSRFEIGEMTGEIFARLAIVTIGFQGDEREFTSIWNNIFSSNPPMERTILDLKARFPLFLLSNTCDLHLAYLTQNYGVLKHFSDGVYSFRAKCAKPDPGIFEKAIKQFGLRPENTLYVDDLEPNVRSASDLGFKAIQYDLTRHDSFTQRLADFGIEF
jgi:HAD superfamily hydrolase (TIGR01509 family)